MVHLAPTLFISAILVGSVAVWSRILERRSAGRPLVAYQPRREVPWSGWHVLAGMMLYLTFQVVGAQMTDRLIGPRNENSPESEASAAQEQATELALPDEGPQAAADKDQPPPPEETAHPLARVLAHRRGIWTIALAIVAAGIVAPLAEELFFRLLLQGWLEARERDWRRAVPLFAGLPRGALPILGSALPFALLHARGAEPEFDVDRTIAIMAGMTVANLLALIVMFTILRFSAGATLEDLGLCPRRLVGDISLGVKAMLAGIVPLYFLQFGLSVLATALHRSGWMPESIAPDPLPLFFLALMLGYLYYRTHRYAPSVVLHMAFNASSLLLLILFSP